MGRIRIGYVRYLNTLPLVEGLESWREVELVPAVPAALAGMLRGEAAASGDGGRAQIDLGLCSIIDVSRPGAELTLVPAGMIGCDGETMTVRVFSKVPMGQVRTLHVDAESHTSVVLARVLLARRFGVRPAVEEIDVHRVFGGAGGAGGAGGTGAAGSQGSGPETVLMIGDKVVTDRPDPRVYAHEIDLGEEWHAWTGLPFVYAMWMCRRTDADKPSLRLAAALLERQRRRNASRLDWLVARHATERGWPLDRAKDYVGRSLRYEVGPREREAVGRFLREAAELGLTGACEPTWMDLNEGVGVA
jgi:chorismate dehydratase